MEYAKCLVELDEVLNHLSVENLKKIPEEIRNGIKKQKDKEYIWIYDEDKKLSEQKLDRNTVAILSYLNMEYLLNDEQKEFMKKIHLLNEQKIEKEKVQKYNMEKIFTNKDDNNSKNENKMIEVKEEHWYTKIFKCIKNIFKKK